MKFRFITLLVFSAFLLPVLSADPDAVFKFGKTKTSIFDSDPDESVILLKNGTVMQIGIGYEGKVTVKGTEYDTEIGLSGTFSSTAKDLKAGKTYKLKVPNTTSSNSLLVVALDDPATIQEPDLSTSTIAITDTPILARAKLKVKQFDPTTGFLKGNMIIKIKPSESFVAAEGLTVRKNKAVTVKLKLETTLVKALPPI